ncbi:hypothetical protein Tco_0895413 [Tanacetum coccineum]|uniref:Uncharacterized protein n=1 Tax=Tanacetum coccineum TaxID=301880 RepID=A0ABQ5CEI4_9ASTR
MARVNIFVDMDTELVKESSKKVEAEMAQESSSKRVGEEIKQEVAKKQKMEDDKEKEDLKQCFKIVQDDEVEIEAIPLATKPAPIVNFQIHRKGRQGYYKIIRADRSSKIYLLFSQLIKSFDREYLETLWKLVKAKHGNTRPEEGYKRVIMGRIIRIKRLLDDLEVTAAKLMLLVYKLLMLVFRVNAAGTKLQLLKRLRLLKEFLLSRDG